jgi:hypothetical protein
MNDDPPLLPTHPAENELNDTAAAIREAYLKGDPAALASIERSKAWAAKLQLKSAGVLHDVDTQADLERIAGSLGLTLAEFKRRPLYLRNKSYFEGPPKGSDAS